MRVLVIGANGRVGRRIVQNLKAAGHHTIAMIRSAEQRAYFESMSVPTVLADLEGPFEHAFQEVEAVIFAAGAPEGAGAEKNLLVDQEGAIKAIDLAERYHVNRFIMLSAKNADQPYHSPFNKSFILAKHRADEHLKKSSLNYTIIRPCRLTDEEPTGHVHLQAHIPEDCHINREDVARVLVHLMDVKAAGKQAFDLQSGSEKIENLFIH